MVFVTIRIKPQAEAKDSDFDVQLIEEDGRQTSGMLRRLDLTSGHWTANLDEIATPPATDIVTQVSGVTPDRRSHSDFEGIANTLYDWLLPAGAVRQRWAALGNPMLYVETPVEALDRLPWEMACPARPPRIRPALVRGLFRLTPHENGALPPAVSRPSSWPFRILIVIGCRADEEVTLGIGREIDAIERIFHPFGRTIDVHCMRRPTRVEMLGWIRRFQPHVFHFAGHARKVAGASQYGLRVESEGGGWSWTSDAIDNDLPKANWTPSFVFLNACRSSTEHSGWSTHRSFLTAGARAVLGMQADVNGDLAGSFASALYKELASGADLEDAVNSARAAIPGAPQDIAWALPAMTTRERNSKLFAPQTLPSDETYEKCAEFEEARLFANCRESRRIFTHWAYPCTAAEKPQNVLLVLGEPKCGKSHLLKWSMENWAIGGARVRYLKIDNGAPKSFLSILRQIRDGDADKGDIRTHYLHAGLPAPAFKRFNWHLNHLVRTGALGEWVEAEHAETEIPDEHLTWTARSDKRPEEEIAPFFLEALRRVAADRPLVLVFDQIEGAQGERLMPVDEFEQLIRHVFMPIAEMPSSLIKVAIVATHTQATTFKLAPLPPRYADRVAEYRVQVNVTDGELAELAAEMLWFQDATTVTQIARNVFQLRNDQNPPPRGLARLASVGKMFEVIDSSYLSAVGRMR
ncbi:hypothetical protein BRAO375_450003 [Bradyrhizobium sp. ORS 375]|uniref:CHAT domain-containing protein n=1 Tax=Bradyrhizobium sp. (strain ORS 375) TaxID=566679 RepID=UPI000240649B|nr:CHAT domain-containing protein [Bradyrhizobium sp. ORS 375]CCD95597.1 hypothetical protein BRAO375_450003 [Bradyrhizobium sp. ORS 375]